MIIWLNGAFGAGKTTTARDLLPLVPDTRLFDPETVGYMLRSHLTDHPVSDVQDWPPWRPLVVTPATELSRYTGQHLIAPQTILTQPYLTEIAASLRAAPSNAFSTCFWMQMTNHFAAGSNSPTRPGSGG